MKIEINYQTNINKSFRAQSLKSIFDLQQESYTQKILAELPIEDLDYQIGLIVGASGSGKTSIAKRIGEFCNFDWSNQNLIDDFPKELTLDEITNALSSVGFNSPPCWLKPYTVLSNGEKMRIDLARAMLEETDKPIIFDEFTSVVDRDVAKITSHAVQKYVRKNKKKFIAVSCHYDIIEWLRPDWIFDTNKKEFFFMKNDPDQVYRLFLESAQKTYGKSLKTITI